MEHINPIFRPLLWWEMIFSLSGGFLLSYGL